MKLTRLIWLPAVLLAGCAPQALGTAPRPVTASPEQAQHSLPTVQKLVDAAVREGRIPAATVAVGVGDAPTTFISAGRITLETGAAADENSLWRIYSMTKPVTGIAAVMLIDEGKLGLDQPIGDFIPEFKTTPVLVDFRTSMETRPAAREITVRDLLTHTSGLAYTAGGGELPVVRELKRLGVTPHTSGRKEEAELRPLRPTSLDEFGHRAGRVPLTLDPGQYFAYSMSLDVLAAVIEKAAGMKFETYLQTRLFTPLGMTSTYWQVPRAEAGRLATNYIAGPKPAEGAANASAFTPLDPAADSVFLDPPSFPYGGAGLVSSAHDFDRLLHMLHNDGMLDGVRIMRPEAARLVRSNLLPPGMVLTDKGPMLKGEPNGFGAGGFVTTLETDGLGRKAGTFGWDGAAGTRAWVDSAQKVRVTTMINVVGGGGFAAEVDKAVQADLGAYLRESVPARQQSGK